MTKVADVLSKKKEMDDARAFILHATEPLTAIDLSHLMGISFAHAEELIDKLESCGEIKRCYVVIRK